MTLIKKKNETGKTIPAGTLLTVEGVPAVPVVKEPKPKKKKGKKKWQKK